MTDCGVRSVYPARGRVGRVTDCGVRSVYPARGRVGRVTDCGVRSVYPARGRFGRVTNCGIRGLGFKSPGSILTSRTETSSLSQVVRDGGDLHARYS